ncbi:MAG TPA: tetratricopeptide repeat protein [Vicinamibacterales bacterium]|nr:tetratricopeptide repeat protein [Vicinamibacterales bacterium]
MLKRRTFGPALVVMALVALVAGRASAQDWRGRAHLMGKVTDEAGTPLEGATVKLYLPEVKEGTTTKTNKKVEWVVNGINSGNWQVEIAMPGYVTRTVNAQVSEITALPEMIIKLKPAPPDPNQIIHDQLVKASGLLDQKKYADARVIYQSILDKYPTVIQVLPLIARTYAEEKNYPKAIETLKLAIDKTPQNAQLKVLLVTLYSDAGDTAQAKALLDSIDPSNIKDPTMLLNIGIAMLNGKKPDDAMTYFDKTITLFPNFADAYYYRGITNLQLEHNQEGKADLEKFVQMAPNAPEAATAKQILAGLKQ